MTASDQLRSVIVWLDRLRAMRMPTEASFVTLMELHGDYYDTFRDLNPLVLNLRQRRGVRQAYLRLISFLNVYYHDILVFNRHSFPVFRPPFRFLLEFRLSCFLDFTLIILIF